MSYNTRIRAKLQQIKQVLFELNMNEPAKQQYNLNYNIHTTIHALSIFILAYYLNTINGEKRRLVVLSRSHYIKGI